MFIIYKSVRATNLNDLWYWVSEFTNEGWITIGEVFEIIENETLWYCQTIKYMGGEE